VQAGVENGAMLTTYLFRYTSECSAPFCSQIFKIFLASRTRQGGIDPLTKILRTFLITALNIGVNAARVAGVVTPQYLTCMGRPVLTTPQYFDKSFIFSI